MHPARPFLPHHQKTKRTHGRAGLYNVPCFMATAASFWNEEGGDDYMMMMMMVVGGGGRGGQVEHDGVDIYIYITELLLLELSERLTVTSYPPSI